MVIASVTLPTDDCYGLGSDIWIVERLGFSICVWKDIESDGREGNLFTEAAIADETSTSNA